MGFLNFLFKRGPKKVVVSKEALVFAKEGVVMQILSLGVPTLFISQMQALSSHMFLIAGAVRPSWFLRALSILLLATLTLCSCTMHHKFYAGADRPESEVALLVYEGTWGDHTIVLKEVDGEKRKFGSAWDGGYRIELLPGTHTLSVFCKSASPVRQEENYGKITSYWALSGIMALEFTAQAGHVYRPKANYENQRWLVWVEDVTGKAN